MKKASLALLSLAVLVGIVPTAAAQLAGKTIVIGIGTPLSGGTATFGVEMKQAVDLAIEEKNAAGGILGAKLATEAADDESSPKKGEAVAQKFCDNSAVLGVIGHVNSGVTIPSSVVYQKCGLAMITPMATNPVVTERGLPNVFRLAGRDDAVGPSVALQAYKQGKRKAVVMDDKTAYGKGIADFFGAQFTKLGGKVLTRPVINVGDKDFRAVLGQLPKDFDVLFFGGIGEAALVVKQMRELGMNQLFACGDGCWDEEGFLRASEGAAAKGEGSLVATTAPEIGKVPGSKEFAEKYAKKYGRIVAYAANSYDSARILLTAIEDAAKAKKGLPTRADVVAAVRKIDFRGIAYGKAVQWDEKGDNRVASIFLTVVEGDRFKEIGEVTKQDLAK